MIELKPICIAAALALVPTATFAHGTHHGLKDTRAGDARIIDRCSTLHYGDRLSCLYSARGSQHGSNPLATGGTIETAGGEMSVSIAPTTLAMNDAAPAASSRVDARPVEELEAAAQRLREAVHALAQAPAGTKRNDAIREANRTLMEVQNALASLPPGIVAASGSESGYKLAMDRLEMASQRLRDAAHALVREPVGAQRADAMKTINKALVDTQQVMLDVSLTRIR